jgi:hypothetical protein
MHGNLGNKVILKLVPVSLTQLVGTMHKICKVQGSNPDQKKKIGAGSTFGTMKFVLLACKLDDITKLIAYNKKNS